MYVVVARKLVHTSLILAALISAACSSGNGADGADAGPSDGGGTEGDGLLLTLQDGKLQGDAVGGSRRFLKIPYAKPPLGDLRWAAPVKNEPAAATSRAPPPTRCQCPGARQTSNRRSTTARCSRRTMAWCS